jgi:molybdopterin/thiamine biosynthesis adenylyltransferase
MKHGRRKEKRRKRRQGTSRASTASAKTTTSAGSTEPAEAPEGSTSRHSVTPWWQQNPERLEYELAQLRAERIEYRVDEAAKIAGILIIDVDVVNSNGGNLTLQARFPDLYPYFRFEIRAPELALPHHQHPFGKQLCVIGRASSNWNTTDTLADFVAQRVHPVLTSGVSNSSTEVSEVEEHQGEPFSDYYRYARDAMILVDSAWSIDPEVDAGTLKIGIAQDSVAESLRGAVLTVSDSQGHVLGEADPAFASIYTKQIDARWIRINEPIVETDASNFLGILRAQDAHLRKDSWRYCGGASVNVIGVLFPEEHTWRGKAANGWVFVVQVRKEVGRETLRGAYLARAGRSGKTDMLGRIPELKGLQDKRIALFGTGALGAPSAIEFARAGIGELRLLDHDFVDPATAVRWPLGLGSSGKTKVLALQEFINRNYPYTKVTPFAHGLGTIREQPDDSSDLHVIPEVIKGVNLIYDATAEIGINHYLSDIAAQYEIPYLCVSTTFGAWGGRLIRIRPNGKTSGCWMCHQWALQDGSIPKPPSNPDGEVQPTGCGDPTFTGASFDVNEVAMAGVRLAIGTLQGEVVNGYPNVEWDIAILTIRDNSALSIPRLEVFPLNRHASCPNESAHKKLSMAATKNR